VGDTYENKGQAGVIGPNAQVGSITINAAQFEERTRDVDFAQLAAELETLKAQMKAAADSAEQFEKVAAVAKAADAAKAGDKPGVLAALQKAGRWALDIAGKIAVPVAIKAIGAAIGLAV
jgi:hypothetical protein